MEKKWTIKCDANCEEHKGEVVAVAVTGNERPIPMVFNYCEAAIEEDRKNGFFVEIIKL